MPNQCSDEDLNAEDLFLQGQEAYEKALHLWQKSLKKTSDSGELASQIRTLLSQAETLPHASVSFR